MGLIEMNTAIKGGSLFGSFCLFAPGKPFGMGKITVMQVLYDDVHIQTHTE
jgi:hypothetical protein